MGDLHNRRLNLKFPFEIIELCNGLEDNHPPTKLSVTTEKDKMMLCLEKREGYITFAFHSKNSFLMKSPREKKKRREEIIDLFLISVKKDSVCTAGKNKKQCGISSDLWKCDICHETFKLKKHYTIHQRTKHKKNRSFVCKICEVVSFSSSKSLSRHLYVKHRKEVTAQGEYESQGGSFENATNSDGHNLLTKHSVKEEKGSIETNLQTVDEENKICEEITEKDVTSSVENSKTVTIFKSSEKSITAIDEVNDSNLSSIKCSVEAGDITSEINVDNSKEVQNVNEEYDENVDDHEILPKYQEDENILKEDISIKFQKAHHVKEICNEFVEMKKGKLNDKQKPNSQAQIKENTRNIDETNATDFDVKSHSKINTETQNEEPSSNSPKLVCCDCSNTGRNPDAITLALHVLYNHKDENSYEKIVNYFDFLQFEGKKVKCTKCDYNYVSDTKSGIRNHLINRHKVDLDFSKIEMYLRESYQQRNMKSGQRKAADGKLQCKICKIFYSSYKAVYKHFMKCHKKTEMSDLLKDIRSQKQKARQNGWYEKDKKVTCHECGFSFKVGKGITHHIKLLHNSNPDLKTQAELSEKYGPFYAENVSTYCCKLCGENCSLKTILHHLKQQHVAEELYNETMTFYTERIQHYSDITKHVSRNSVYTNKVKLCSFCQKVLSTANYNKHVKTCKLNPNRIQFYHCYCGYRTESKDRHNTHKSKCERQVPETLYCEICGLACSSRATLCSHRREKHQVGIQKPVVLHTCSKCDKSFWRKQSYMKHTLIHSLTKDHICETCGKAFRTPSDLKKHQDTQHDNKFRYRCSKCGHGMEKEKYLKSHVCGRVRRKQNTNITSKQSLSTTTAVKPSVLVENVTEKDSISLTPKELAIVSPTVVGSSGTTSENIVGSENCTDINNIVSTPKLDSIQTSTVHLADISRSVPGLITINSSTTDFGNIKSITSNLPNTNIHTPNLVNVNSNASLVFNNNIPNVQISSSLNVDNINSNSTGTTFHHQLASSNPLITTNANIPATVYSVNEQNNTIQNLPHSMDILQSAYNMSEIIKPPSLSVVYNEQNHQHQQHPSFIQQMPQNVEYKLDIGNSVFNDILQSGDRTLVSSVQVVSSNEYYMDGVNTVALPEQNSNTGSTCTNY